MENFHKNRAKTHFWRKGTAQRESKAWKGPISLPDTTQNAQNQFQTGIKASHLTLNWKNHNEKKSDDEKQQSKLCIKWHHTVYHIFFIFCFLLWTYHEDIRFHKLFIFEKSREHKLWNKQQQQTDTEKVSFLCHFNLFDFILYLSCCFGILFSTDFSFSLEFLCIWLRKIKFSK